MMKGWIVSSIVAASLIFTMCGSGTHFKHEAAYVQNPFPDVQNVAIIMVHDRTEKAEKTAIDDMIDIWEDTMKKKDIAILPHFMVRGFLEASTHGDISSAFDLDLAYIAQELGVEAFFVGEIIKYEYNIGANLSSYNMLLKWKLIGADSFQVMWEDNYESFKKKANSKGEDIPTIMNQIMTQITETIASTLPLGTPLIPEPVNDNSSS